MSDTNIHHLSSLISGLQIKIYATFFRKLFLIDEEKLETRNVRHYDYECQGLSHLLNFLQRRMNKNTVFAFQTLRDYQPSMLKKISVLEIPSNNYLQPRLNTTRLQFGKTGSTRNFTRANSSIQQSDNSFIFSPHLKKNINRNKTEYFNNSSLTENGDRSQILQKLLKRVKTANIQAHNETLKPAKSSYFNLTLGAKQSLQTFKNGCNCNCTCHYHEAHHKTDKKQMKRKIILQRFQQIQKQIKEQQAQNSAEFSTMPLHKYRQRLQKAQVHSVYEPSTFQQRPESVYLLKNNDFQQQELNSLATSKSVAHMTYSKRVYI